MSIESELDRSIRALRSDMSRMSADLNAEIDRRCSNLERAMERKRVEERGRAELVQWILLIWLADIVLTVGVKLTLRAFGLGG